VLIGGAGTDIFSFTFVADSPGPIIRDALQAGDGGMAFDGAGAPELDHIDLHSIPGLEFGVNLFCIPVGTTTRVVANTDGDPAFDLQIDILDGAVLASAYTEDDFIL
jgi:hypothetical protein